jgi:polysaccharide export outer membrane protein
MERPMLRFFWCLLMTGLITGCVPNSRILYLQSSQEPELNAVTNRDSVVRQYTTRYQDYTLKSGDIISLRIGTLTPNGFDFIQKYEEDLGLVRKLNQYDQANVGGGINQRMNAGGGGGGGGGGGNAGVAAAQSGLNIGLAPILLDRMQTGFILSDSGVLELPKVGNLKLEGLTITEAEKLVKEKLMGYFETPVVRIQLLSFHFTILGEVNKEGRYTIFNPNATIFDAITLSDNLTDFADRSNIKIVRTVKGQASVTYVNTLREDLLAQSGFYLQPNDLIIVPPLKARTARRYTLPNSTTGVSLLISTLSLVLLIVNFSTR